MTSNQGVRVLGGSSQSEVARRRAMVEKLPGSRAAVGVFLDNIRSYLAHRTLSRIDFMQQNFLNPLNYYMAIQ